MQSDTAAVPELAVAGDLGEAYQNGDVFDTMLQPFKKSTRQRRVLFYEVLEARRVRKYLSDLEDRPS